MNRTFVLLLAVSLLLAACAPQAAVTSEAAVTSTPTPPPTQPPIPTPTFHPAFVEMQSRLADLGLSLLPDGTI